MSLLNIKVQLDQPFAISFKMCIYYENLHYYDYVLLLH